MNKKSNSFRAQLLALGQPAGDKLVRYQEETEAMLEQMQKGLRREKWGMWAIWSSAVLFVTATLLIIGFRGRMPEVTVLAFGFLMLIYGGLEIVKHFVNRSRVEILTELKSLELQVLALQERLPPENK
jgi:uncharacterized membrane protein HdeD (DUF308 family)